MNDLEWPFHASRTTSAVAELLFYLLVCVRYLSYRMVVTLPRSELDLAKHQLKIAIFSNSACI